MTKIWVKAEVTDALFSSERVVTIATAYGSSVSVVEWIGHIRDGAVLATLVGGDGRSLIVRVQNCRDSESITVDASQVCGDSVRHTPGAVGYGDPPVWFKA